LGLGCTDSTLLLHSPYSSSFPSSFPSSICYDYYYYHHHLLGVVLEEALMKACRVATISVTRKGTQSSYPHKEELPDDLRIDR